MPKCSTYIRTIFILLLSKFLLLNLPNKEDIIYPSGHTVRTATERENRQTKKQYTRNQTKPLIWQFNLSSCNQLGEFPAAASAAAAFSYFFQIAFAFFHARTVSQFYVNFFSEFELNSDWFSFNGWSTKWKF